MLMVHPQKYGSDSLLYLRGHLVIGEIDTLRNAVQDQLDCWSISLDLQGVTRIDARGLGVLLELREKTQAYGIAFRLMNLPRLVNQVFEISRLDGVFEISSEEDVMCAVTANV